MYAAVRSFYIMDALGKLAASYFRPQSVLSIACFVSKFFDSNGWEAHTLNLQ